MAQSTRLFLIRHGETEWNVAHIAQGHLDSLLTERGVAQCQALGRRLKGYIFDTIYSSDLGRCQKTAQYAIGETGQPIHLDERLRERNLGVVQGLNRQQARAQLPEVAAGIGSRDPDYVVPEGESVRQMLDRMLAFLEDMLAQHAGETVLVVSHGGVLSVLMRHLLGLSPEQPRKFYIRNAGLNVIVHGEEGWMVETLGDVAHLTELVE